MAPARLFARFPLAIPSLPGYCGGMTQEMKKYASAFARMGGLSKSPARAAASRANGKLGGRPRKPAAPAVKQAGKRA